MVDILLIKPRFGDGGICIKNAHRSDIATLRYWLVEPTVRTIIPHEVLI